MFKSNGRFIISHSNMKHFCSFQHELASEDKKLLNSSIRDETGGGWGEGEERLSLSI